MYKRQALNSSIQENVKGIRVVKSFVREDYEKEKFDRAAEDVCSDFTRAERILAINNPLMQFCVYAVMVFVLSFGSVSYTHLDVYKRQRIISFQPGLSKVTPDTPSSMKKVGLGKPLSSAYFKRIFF